MFSDTKWLETEVVATAIHQKSVRGRASNLSSDFRRDIGLIIHFATFDLDAAVKGNVVRSRFMIARL